MKVYKPHIHDYGYPLGATDELREALNSLGFKFVQPHINRGCHWGYVYFFNKENLELAKSLMDSENKHFLIETNKRYFYLSPYISRYEPEIGPHWQFSVESNKPREYKHVVRKKRGPYAKT